MVPFAVGLGGEERGQQIVAGGCEAFGQQVVEVAVERLGAVDGVGAFVGGGRQPEERSHSVAEAREPGAVGGGNT